LWQLLTNTFQICWARSQRMNDIISNTVICLERSQIDTASQMLCHAFDRDPMLGYITQDAGSRKPDIIKNFCTAILRYSQPYHHTYTTEDLKGIAVWIPPGYFPINFVQLFQSGLYTLPFKLGFKGFRRWLSLFTLDTYHRQDLPEPHWYLLLLAISPEHQGQGVGSSLLAPILTQADYKQIPCYVEVFTEAAVNFYRKHGFEMVRTVLLSKHAPCFWTMRRKPQNQVQNQSR